MIATNRALELILSTEISLIVLYMSTYQKQTLSVKSFEVGGYDPHDRYVGKKTGILPVPRYILGIHGGFPADNTCDGIGFTGAAQ
jgi:hypothetical protein